MALRFLRRVRSFGVDARGVIHVGAHEAQELRGYLRFGFERQLWIEPQPEIFARLVAKLPKDPMVRAAQVACGDSAGQATMHVLNNNDGMSNSLLEPKLHLSEYPQITRGGTFTVPVARLDDVIEQQGFETEQFSLLAVDVQGFEMQVFKGAPRTLQTIGAVVAEVYNRELYAGCALLPEIDACLEAAGLERVGLRWTKHHYGDALYVRRGSIKLWHRLRQGVLGPLRR